MSSKINNQTEMEKAVVSAFERARDAGVAFRAAVAEAERAALALETDAFGKEAAHELADEVRRFYENPGDDDDDYEAMWNEIVDDLNVHLAALRASHGNVEAYKTWSDLLADAEALPDQRERVLALINAFTGSKEAVPA